MKRYIIILLVASISACTTIHFESGKNIKGTAKTEKLHHNLHFGFYELSDPVDLQTECGDSNWTKVTTKRSAANSLPTFIPALIVYESSPVLSFLFIVVPSVMNNASPFWSPQTVTIECEVKN